MVAAEMNVAALAMVVFAIESYNFLAIPFLTLFVGGYYWAGCTTLWDEYQGKLAWQRQQLVLNSSAISTPRS